MIKKIVFSILMVFSVSVFADTYPVISSTTYQASNINTGGAAPSSSSLSGACDNGSAPPINILTAGSNGRACTFTQRNSPPDYVSITYGPIDNYSAVTITVTSTCPAGGTVSGSSCINAPSCTAPQIRNTSTGMCENPPVTCNYTPTLTTFGEIQTIHWQIDGGNNTCTDQSVSCQSPLVANVEMKRCDLLCSDGSTANVDGGAICPPPVCVGEQTVNIATNTCQDPVCSSLQVLNPQLHICLDNLICVGGQTRNTSTMPYSCSEPVCTGFQILDTSSHTCIDPPPAVCTGSQVLNTATNTCTDPVCDSGYHLNADKVCEISSECPLFTQRTLVDGVLKCVTTPTKTTSSPTPAPGDSTGGASGGGASGSPTPGTGKLIPNPDGTTTIKLPDMTCDDCAKESTLRKVVEALSPLGDTPDLTDSDKPVRDAMQGVIDDVHGVDTTLGTNPSATLGMTSSYWGYASGTCFPAVFDMGRFGDVSLENFCNIYDTHIRPLLVMVLGVFGVLHVFSYWHTTVRESMG